ncbi:MAG: heparinase, partial [Hyphomicrobiaceae bacterium]
MSAPTVAERLHIARLCGDAAASSLASRLAGLPLLGWRTLRPRADELLFVPSDMRPADPGLADEIAAGQMGLGGAVLDLAGSSPFAVVAPDRAWARELIGFAWLGGLRTAGGKDVADLARSLVADWCRRNRRMPGGRGL